MPLDSIATDPALPYENFLFDRRDLTTKAVAIVEPSSGSSCNDGCNSIFSDGLTKTSDGRSYLHSFRSFVWIARYCLHDTTKRRCFAMAEARMWREDLRSGSIALI